MKLIVRLKGGPGSGHHGHSGRPGKVGGSSPDVGGFEYYERVLKPKYDKAAAQAKANPGKSYKVHKGMYIMAGRDGTLWELDHLDEGPNRGMWIAREYDKGNPYYTDPVRTKRELELGL